MDINAKINKRNAERLLDELMDECKRIGYEHAEDELKSLRAKVETLRRENQKLRAMLSDEKNGTPCAQIRWQQERDDLRRDREELLAALLEISQVARSLSPEQKIANSTIAKVKP